MSAHTIVAGFVCYFGCDVCGDTVQDEGEYLCRKHKPVLALRAEKRRVEAERNAQWWDFTRSLRGRPVEARITRRLGELEYEIREARSKPLPVPEGGAS